MTDACPTAAGSAPKWSRVARARMPSAAVLLVAVAICPSCAAREDNAEAVARDDEQRPAIDESDAAESEALARPVLRDPSRAGAEPKPARTFKSYGVGPTIDTTEEPTSRVDLDLDVAAYALTRAAIAAGELPPPATVRVEEFLAAIPPASPAPDVIAIEVDAVASPQRPGYQLLRIAIRAPRGDAAPIDVVFAIDGTAPMRKGDQLASARAAVLAAAASLRPNDRIGVVLIGARAKELVPLAAPNARALAKALAVLDETTAQKPAPDLGLDAVYPSLGLDPARTAHVVVLTTGVLPGSDPKLPELVAREAVAGRRTSALGIGVGAYDDATLERIAHAGRGRYAFADDPDEAARMLDHARQPVIAIAPRLTVRFDPTVVALYRLIGYESRGSDRSGDGPGTEPSVIVAGDTATVLYEVELVEDTTARWGEVELQFTAPVAGRTQRLLADIDGLDANRELARAGADMQLATIAAGTAEKLRGSFWARGLSWEQLAALHAGLPAAVRKRADVAELGRLVAELGKLDPRRDRHESRSPQPQTDFDRLQVIE